MTALCEETGRAPHWRFSGELNVPTLLTIAGLATSVAMWAATVNATVGSIEVRLAALEQRNSDTPERMARIEAYAEANVASLSRIERRMDELEQDRGGGS